MDAADWSRHDVVIVGARVAGSATAMLLARLGYDVAVVDQATFPSDTLSTHSIARSGIVQLHLPARYLSGDTDVHRPSKAAERRHRQGGSGTGGTADPRRAPACDCLIEHHRHGRKHTA
jgi:glycine/D-amino acid oxidase-like deaminating enzyme